MHRVDSPNELSPHLSAPTIKPYNARIVIHFATTRITVCHCSLPTWKGTRKIAVEKKRRRNAFPNPPPSQWLKSKLPSRRPAAHHLQISKTRKGSEATPRT